jgi:catechol 2,3-dioxygenase-like lactoylglutathione lyase family enzyme
MARSVEQRDRAVHKRDRAPARPRARASPLAPENATVFPCIVEGKTLSSIKGVIVMAFSFTSVVPVLAVDDLDRAARFYEEKLGCRVLSTTQDPTSRIVEIGDAGWLLIYKSEFRRGAETTVASLMVDDVERAVSELRSKGVQFEEYDLPNLKTEQGIATYGDYKSAWFKDSEGNIIAVVPQESETMYKAA